MKTIYRFIAASFLLGMLLSISACALSPEERRETRQEERVEQRTQERMEDRRD